MEDLVMALTTLFRPISQWKQYRDTVSALSKLSSRELDDLGITRGDIDVIAAARGTTQR